MEELKQVLKDRIDSINCHHELLDLEFLMYSNEFNDVLDRLLESRHIGYSTNVKNYLLSNFIRYIDCRTPEKLFIMEKVLSGEYFDVERFLNSSDPMDIRLLVSCDHITKRCIQSLIDYTSYETGGMACGKGEFLLNVLIPDSQKKTEGGDIYYNGLNLEVKGMASGLEGASTNRSLNPLKNKFLDQFKIDHLPHITAKNINGFYREHFKTKKEFADFLIEVFNFVYTPKNKTQFKYVYDCIEARTLIFDYQNFFEKHCRYEYDRYCRLNKIDKIVFINNKNFHIFVAQDSDHFVKNLKNFNITLSFSFDNQRQKCLRYQLR